MAAFHQRQKQPRRVYDLLPPERKAGRPQAVRFERLPDISDAEFVTVAPERRSAASARGFNDNRRPATSRRTRRSPLMAILVFVLGLIERWLQRASARSFFALVAALVVLAFGLAGGFSGLSAQSAPAPGALGFSHVSLNPRDANGMHILVLNGVVENGTTAVSAIPPIRADLVVDERVVASVMVPPPVASMRPGESHGFSARLRHPGGKIPEVRLSFMPQGVSAR